VIVLWSKCVDHLDWFFLWLPGPILPSLVVPLLGHCCLFGVGTPFVDD
jgi:hypothetical protein